MGIRFATRSMLVSAADREPGALVARAVERSLSGRVAAATQEVQQLVEATYRIVSRDGTVDPRVRDILLEADLSTQAACRLPVASHAQGPRPGSCATRLDLGDAGPGAES